MKMKNIYEKNDGKGRNNIKLILYDIIGTIIYIYIYIYIYMYIYY